MGKEREPIQEHGTPMVPGYRLRITSADRDGAFIHISCHNAHLCVNVSAKHLREFAAQCLEAADEVDADKRASEPTDKPAQA